MSSLSLTRDILRFRPKSPSYQYAPLSTERKDIRLLRLLPAGAQKSKERRFSTSAPKIRCETITTPLTSCPPFTALSYAWGDTKQNQDIEIDGRSMLISTNLRDALQQFLADEVPLSEFFWIDAICINQKDTMEKNHQVQLMGEIYRHATKVIAWLGHVDASCAFAMESIQEVYAAGVFSQDGIREAIATAENSKTQSNQALFGRVRSHLDTLLDRFEFDAVVKAVEVLLSRAWWRRLWVLQELVLSKTAFIRCGPLAVTWTVFEYFLDVCELFMLCYPTDPLYYSAYVIGYKAFILSKSWRQHQRGESSTMFQLFEMMITMAIRETSDPRDRVYALLGLAEDGTQLGVHPDYSLSCAKVYSVTMEALIQKHGLILLSYCSYTSKSKTRTPNLPSWAPDLAETVIDPLRGDANTAFYQASGTSDSSFYFEDCEGVRVLKVRATVVGIITTKTRERPSPEASFNSGKAKILRKWLQAYESYVQHAYHVATAGYGKQASVSWDMYVEAMWRTPIANRISKRGQEGSREAQFKDKAGYKLLLSQDEEQLSSADDVVNDYYYSAWLRTTKRCLFTTSEGHVGLGSSELWLGDYICVFQGADIPFIVRGNERDDYCHLIGEAYVHGIMNGEFMRNPPLQLGYAPRGLGGRQRFGPLYIN